MKHAPRTFALLLLAVLSVSRARANAPVIEPYLDRTTFDRLVARLRLDDDQRLVAELVYGDYVAAVETLREEAMARAEAAGRSRVEGALAGRILLEGSELTRLRVAVERSWSESWPEADRLLAELIANIRTLPTQEPPDAESAFAEARRAVLLLPRRADSKQESYAGDGVDVLALLDAACAPGAELAERDRDALVARLRWYERELDAVLVATAAADRAGRWQQRVARIERDRETAVREAREAVVRWRAVYDLNARAAATIAEAAGAIDESARRAWIERFETACFSGLFAPTRADRHAAWIERGVREPRSLASAREIMAVYERDRAALRAEAIELLVQGRFRSGVPIHARMNATGLDEHGQAIHRALLKNTGAFTKLDTDTVAALESLLTESQQEQMQSDLAAEAYGRRQ